jgi:hypothetical protein
MSGMTSSKADSPWSAGSAVSFAYGSALGVAWHCFIDDVVVLANDRMLCRREGPGESHEWSA